MPGGFEILTFNQAQQFKSTGILRQSFMEDERIPQYSFTNQRSQIDAGKNWKLFPQYISLSDLEYLYKRVDIATNAVDIPPADVWGKAPLIKDLDSSGAELQNSETVKDIAWLNRNKAMMAKFEEAHRYARMVGLGIVVSGLADGKLLSEPVTGKVARRAGLDYIRVYSASEIAEIVYYQDPKSDTYGEIEMYHIQIKGESARQVDMWVHSDRVEHFYEKTIKSSAWGISVLESPYDLFQILKNTDWSAGEAYYQNAAPLWMLSWEDAADVDPPTDAELDKAETDMANMNVRQKYIKPASWKLEPIHANAELPDPNKIYKPIVERISGGVKVPMQLLLGTSAGALASGETNLNQYYAHISNMQDNLAEPTLLKYYGKLMEWGVISEGDVDLEWKPLYEEKESDKAQVMLTKMQTAVAAQGEPISGKPPLMSQEEIRTQILGLTAEFGGGRNAQLTLDQQMEGPTATGQQLDAYSDTGGLFLKPINRQVRSGKLSVEDAKTMVDDYLGGLGVVISERIVNSLLRNAPPEKQAEIRLGGLGPKSLKMLTKQVETMRDEAYKQIDVAATPEPIPQ